MFQDAQSGAVIHAVSVESDSMIPSLYFPRATLVLTSLRAR